MPKGAAVEQRAVTRLVVNTNYVQLGASDRIAQASNISFDAATFEIWGALLNGGRLVIVPKDVLLSAPALAAEIETHGINTMFMTTSLFNEHAAHAPETFRGLRQLMVGGERLDPIAIQRVLRAVPPARLLNGYGPTETTTFATWFEIPHTLDPDTLSIPIGRPLANTRCYVLDAFMQPVPVGVIGELYIGGVGVARGYLNRPQLTAERFVDDPFAPGERLYRTGDLVRYLPDGTIDYVGRADRQIKLRGFRIEPGEIEMHLGRLPGVAQCAVIVCDEDSGDQRLVAYVVASDPVAAPSAEALSDALARRLPPYLVPSKIVLLKALPLTANGKLDTAALSGLAERSRDERVPASAPTAPVQPAIGAESDPRAPADEWEQRLQVLWQKLLRVDDIGCEDNFFELGGHSLLAIRLIDAIDKTFGRSLSIANFFHAPTIRDQALLLRQQYSITSCVIAVQSRGKRPPLFVVPGYGGAVTPFHALAKALGADQPLYLVDLNSVGCEPPQSMTLESVAAQVVESMRGVQPHGPYQLAGYSLGGRIAYEIAQQLLRHGEAIDLLAMLDCGAPGYPRVQSFVSRTFLHIKHGLKLGPGESRAYFADRVRSLRKYLKPERVYPPVFAEDVVEKAMEAARAIEARSQAVYDAWLAYEPRKYRGAISVVRATVRPTRLGVMDDDPHLGWGRLNGNRVRLAHIDCDHMKMLEPQNLPALAKLLRGWLGATAQPSRPREEALTA
jgi:thioesterase domain-containing protein